MSAVPTSVMDKLDALATQVKAQQDQITALGTASNEDRSGVGLFHARRGENSMGSRGYSFTKGLGLIAGEVAKEDAKMEIDFSNRLHKYYRDKGYNKIFPNSVMMPVGAELLALGLGEESFANEVKQSCQASVAEFNPQESVAEVRRKMVQGGYTKALSWLDETVGGALVAPPLMGELIEVLRNNEVLMAAGARLIAMPPQGRITMPRQTGAGTAYWVGESTQITDSTQTTGDVVLQAKKLGMIVKVPNELFRFSSIAVEAFLREDVGKVMALKLDKALLEDAGSATTPKGLINYAGINTYTASTTGTNGDTYTPRDVAKMIGTVEEQNAHFKAFIMRPLMWAGLVNLRADAVTAGDQQGPFLFNILRELGTPQRLERLEAGQLSGYPVLKSTNISKARAKGSATNLSYILGGDFADYIVALSGTMEFMVSREGDTPFQQDQTWFRATQYCDGMPRHEASFVLCDTLVVP